MQVYNPHTSGATLQTSKRLPSSHKGVFLMPNALFPALRGANAHRSSDLVFIETTSFAYLDCIVSRAHFRLLHLRIEQAHLYPYVLSHDPLR